MELPGCCCNLESGLKAEEDDAALPGLVVSVHKSQGRVVQGENCREQTFERSWQRVNV